MRENAAYSIQGGRFLLVELALPAQSNLTGSSARLWRNLDKPGCISTVHWCAAYWLQRYEQARKDPVRENRIDEEATIDDYGLKNGEEGCSVPAYKVFVTEPLRELPCQGQLLNSHIFVTACRYLLRIGAAGG